MTRINNNATIVLSNKIKVTEETVGCGYNIDQEYVKKFLTINKEYTVDYTTVGGSHTYVYIKEIPDISFNSVNFADVSYQSEDMNKLHSDYYYYNKLQ